MTPQESQLVDELFDRLAKLETVPRDPAAERLIADGAQRAPHALYALMQTALLQDEALRRANARIEELQAQVDGAEEPQQQQGSFLDSMREAVLGPREPRGSVPSVRAQSSQSQSSLSQGTQSQAGYPPQAAPPGYPAAPAFGSGGSFLGTAASAAAGVVGGALLLDGIRSMFGHHPAGANPSAFGNLAGDRALPWSGGGGGSAADSRLARDAGIEHIGDRTQDAGEHRSDAPDESYETADADDVPDDDDLSDDGDFSDENYDA